MSDRLKPIDADWEIVQVLHEDAQEASYRVRHRRNGDLRMLRILPLDSDAAMRMRFQVESQVAAEMGGAVPVEPFEVSISEDRAFVLMQDTGTLDGLQFGWEEDILPNLDETPGTDELRPYLRSRIGETVEMASGTVRVSAAAAAEGPFLAAVTETLGNRSWMVHGFATQPVAVEVDFPEGCGEDDLIALCESDARLKISLGKIDEVLRVPIANPESLVALALYPSGTVRGLSGVFQANEDLCLIVDDPISLIDPEAELELPAANGLRASLRMVALSFSSESENKP